MNIILQFLAALPELIRLVRDIETAIKKEESDRKVKNDVKAIREAFKNQDAQALNRIFNPTNGDKL